jgi:hypothetical protein
MLNKAHSLYDTLISIWNAGKNEDDIQLSLYTAMEAEFDSGITKKGLLAKVSVEANYDDKVTKAKYIKARVDALMVKRERIVDLMRSIDTANKRMINIDVALKSLSQPTQVDTEPTAEDFLKAERDFNTELARTTYLLDNTSATYNLILLTLYATSFGILAWLVRHIKPFVMSWISAGLTAVVFLTLTALLIGKRKKISLSRLEHVVKDKRTELEQVNFIEKKANQYFQERLKDREVSFLIHKQDLEKEREVLQQKIRSLDDELQNIFS